MWKIVFLILWSKKLFTVHWGCTLKNYISVLYKSKAYYSEKHTNENTHYEIIVCFVGKKEYIVYYDIMMYIILGTLKSRHYCAFQTQQLEPEMTWSRQQPRHQMRPLPVWVILFLLWTLWLTARMILNPMGRDPLPWGRIPFPVLHAKGRESSWRRRIPFPVQHVKGRDSSWWGRIPFPVLLHNLDLCTRLRRTSKPR